MAERAASQKTPHHLVDYTPKSPHVFEQCRRCKHFLRHPNRCETVKDPIVPPGWCVRFDKKPKT
jgi:hypothetical protein